MTPIFIATILSIATSYFLVLGSYRSPLWLLAALVPMALLLLLALAPELRIGRWRTDYGCGPRRTFLTNGPHAVTVPEFFRHPLKALRVLFPKEDDHAS